MKKQNKFFNEKVKKETEIYNVFEPDTLKSVLETENTLISSSKTAVPEA